MYDIFGSYVREPPRRLTFAVLYFSEGAPIGYIWWALPTKLRAAGIPVERISQLTAILILPWAFKFLWAPLVDAFPLPRIGVRGWIVFAQTCMGITLIPLMFFDPGQNLGLFSAILLAHAFAAATQDAAVDAYAIASVPTKERGSINAWMQVGMLAGRSVFGGITLYVERWIGSAPVVAALLICIWSTMLFVLFVGQSSKSPVPFNKEHCIQSLTHTLQKALKRKATWLGIVFAAFGGSSYEALGSVAGPMLIDGGVSQENSGLFFAVPAVVCMGVGALAGGRIGDRFGRTASVIGFMFAIAAITIATALVFAFASSHYFLFISLAVLYIFVGAFIASSYALFMDVTDSRLGATQFSAFMGATNLCEAWSAWAVGSLIMRLGYPMALCLMTVPTLLTTVFVRHLTGQDQSNGQHSCPESFRMRGNRNSHK